MNIPHLTVRWYSEMFKPYLSRHVFSQMDEGVSCSSFQGFGSDGVIT